jgi:hypothetical protein
MSKSSALAQVAGSHGCRKRKCHVCKYDKQYNRSAKNAPSESIFSNQLSVLLAKYLRTPANEVEEPFLHPDAKNGLGPCRFRHATKSLPTDRTAIVEKEFLEDVFPSLACTPFHHDT